jgi:hypothetical protein
MNSFIITDSGVSMLIHSKPYVVSNGHENFEAIMDALRKKDFDVIPGLISKLVAVADKLETLQSTNDDIIVDLQGGIVTCQGTELPSTLAKRMIRMVEEGFDIAPLRMFITNLFGNPSNSTIQDLYTFLEYGQLPITEDGFFVAYKKINLNWTDCHTGEVLNQPASTMHAPELAALILNPKRAGKVTTCIDKNGETEVSMLRRHVDDRSEQTCSSGLHFCSFEYLRSFSGARVVAVKINPADVVSIPVDYNNTKGRCSKYVVMHEITDNTNVLTEKSVYGASTPSDVDEDVDVDVDEDSTDTGLVYTPAPFVPSDTPNVSEEEWYFRGHSDGRKHEGICGYVPSIYQPYYDLGYKHGKGREGNIYGRHGVDEPKVTSNDVFNYDKGYTDGKGRAAKYTTGSGAYYELGYRHGKGHKTRQFKP